MTTTAPVIKVVEEPVPGTIIPVEPMKVPEREPVLVPVRKEVRHEGMARMVISRDAGRLEA